MNAGPQVPFAAPPAPLEAAIPVTGRKSVSRRLRRRRRSRWKNAIVPLLFGGLFLGLLYWLFAEIGTPNLNGRLMAEFVDGPFTARALIPQSQMSQLDRDEVHAVLDGLAREPLQLRSDLMTAELRGSQDGIEVTLDSAPATRFVRVLLSDRGALVDWAYRMQTELDAPRRDEQARAIKRFIPDWIRSDADDLPLPDGMRYRNDLVINSLVHGLGYSVEAVVGRRTHPCVHEDSRNLYFVLPRGTKSFELVGRQLPDGTVPFPGRYTVHVQ